MKKLIPFILILCLAWSDAKGQTSISNHQRYWYYRYRLTNDFLLIGDCQGCSLPAGQRNLRNNTTYTELYQLYWGDATINLGWYIGVLGTEYKLLKNDNQDVSQTVKELYYALKAFNRLDENAESYWRCATCASNPQAGDLNGFFIRDDVPGNFLSLSRDDITWDDAPNNYMHFNQGLTSTSLVNSAESDFHSLVSAGRSPKEMSHDQVYHLLAGLALVNKFVDADVNYNGLSLNNIDGNIYILQEARNIVTRIVTYMKEHDDWVIKNPVTGDCLLNTATPPQADCSGNGTGNAAWLSYGVAEAACFAANEFDVNTGWPPTICDDFHNSTSIANDPVWQAYKGVSYPPSSEYYKILNLAAIGNSWRGGTPPVTFDNTALRMAELIEAWSVSENDYHYLTLLRQVLHDGPNYISDSQYTDLLNTAPCQGPYNFGNDHYDSYEWSSTNRLMDPENRENNDFPGEYPGLDYMLLHNLYYIIRNEDDFNTNLMDIRDIADFPFGPSIGQVGTQASPYEVDAFRFIYGDNILDTNAVVTYRAGKEIRLLPGFDVKPGADFHAYIDPFTCQNGTYQRTVAGDSTASDYGFSYPAAISHPVSKHEKPSTTYQYLAPSPAPAPHITTAQDHISVHPNPSNGVFTITGIQEASSEVSVYDVHGKLVIHEVGITGGEMSIDLTGYPAGVYAITIRSGNTITVKRAVVE